MIIYETEHAFVMTKQHDHALLSKLMAVHWKDEYYKNHSLWEEALYAIAQHDRAWIKLDNSPIWNDAASKPYSFINYPLSIKLPSYVKGIDEVERVSNYAALLCSTHYTKFFHDEDLSNEIIHEFLQGEKQRQKDLSQKLNKKNKLKEEIIDYHYHLLKFFDTFSLFICMQEAGVRDEQVHKWFREGIENHFAFFDVKHFQTNWKNKNTIEMTPFPFKISFDVTIPMRVVTKELIKKIGLIAAFEQTPAQIRSVKISF